jgi:hypothetical protein
MGDPTISNEVYFHKDTKKRNVGRKAIKIVILKMEKSKVWSFINQKEINLGKKPTGRKLVFVQERDGSFRARLVVLG